MWWLLGTAIGCLIVGYWFGHWRGWCDYREEVRGDLDYLQGKHTDAESDVIWCYRHILNREPESSGIVKRHASGNPSIYKIAKAFMNTEEFKRQHTIDKERARRAFERLERERFKERP